MLPLFCLLCCASSIALCLSSVEYFDWHHSFTALAMLEDSLNKPQGARHKNRMLHTTSLLMGLPGVHFSQHVSMAILINVFLICAFWRLCCRFVAAVGEALGDASGEEAGRPVDTTQSSVARSISSDLCGSPDNDSEGTGEGLNGGIVFDA